MPGRFVLPGSGASNNHEQFDSGWSSYDNLTNTTDTDIVDILSTTNYSASTVSMRHSSSISETIMKSSSMGSSTLALASDLTTVSCSISMVSIRETCSSSVTSRETYAANFLFTKDDENENSTVNSTISSYPMSAPKGMFPPYQSMISDEKEDTFTEESNGNYIYRIHLNEFYYYSSTRKDK